MSSLKDIFGNVPEPRKIVPIPDHYYYYRFCGRTGIRYVMRQTKKVLTAVSFSLLRDFAFKRNFLKTHIGNCSLGNGDAPPSNPAHEDGFRLDFNYFTYKKNWTHYVPVAKQGNIIIDEHGWKRERDLVMIWEEPLEGRGLLTNVLDGERSFLLISRLLDCYKYGTAIVHTKIKDHLRYVAKSMYPDEWDRTRRKIQIDSSVSLGHGYHIHVDMGTKDVPDGLNVLWEKELDWL